MKKTLGSLTIPREPRVICEYLTGKQLVIDIHGMSKGDFKELLRNVLTREITEESRRKIMEALEEAVVSP